MSLRYAMLLKPAESIHYIYHHKFPTNTIKETLGHQEWLRISRWLCQCSLSPAVAEPQSPLLRYSQAPTRELSHQTCRPAPPGNYQCIHQPREEMESWERERVVALFWLLPWPVDRPRCMNEQLIPLSLPWHLLSDPWPWLFCFGLRTVELLKSGLVKTLNKQTNGSAY